MPPRVHSLMGQKSARNWVERLNAFLEPTGKEPGRRVVQLVRGFVYAVALSATVVLPACGGGGSTPAATLPTSTIPTASSPTVKASFTITLPLSAASASSIKRSPQLVVPQTKTLYFALQNAPGVGNAQYAFTFPIDSTHCMASADGMSQSCSYSATVPIGLDTFHLLTTDAKGIPLAYDPNIVGTVNADGSGLNGVVFDLQPIIGKGVSTYKFQVYTTIHSSATSLPGITTAFFDADGNALSETVTNESPFGTAFSTVTVTQDIGQFQPALGSVAGANVSPTNTLTFGAMGNFGAILQEIGDGTTAPFTANITTTTPAVSFTSTEFPTLTAAAALPASSTSFSLTCQFTTTTPTVDPCPGTATISIPIH